MSTGDYVDDIGLDLEMCVVVVAAADDNSWPLCSSLNQ